MASLSNPKHELFAQEVAKGSSAAKAYVAAGYSAHTGNASKLAREASIKARVAEIQAEQREMTRAATEQATNDLGISIGWVLSGLKQNAERAMQVVPVLDSKGRETGEYKYEGNVANKAYELIGKHLGMFVEKTEAVVEVRNVVSDEPMTGEAWEAETAARLKIN